MATKEHRCTSVGPCRCYQLADEPSEDCPLHGYPDPRRCVYCGRFFKQTDTPPVPAQENDDNGH